MHDSLKSSSGYHKELDEALNDEFLRRTLDTFAVAYRANREAVFKEVDEKALIKQIADAKDYACQHMPLAWLVCVICGLVGWKLSPTYLLALSLQGVVVAIGVLIIVFGAILILYTLEESGGMTTQPCCSGNPWLSVLQAIAGTRAVSKKQNK